MTTVTTRAPNRRDLRAVLGRVATHGYLVLLVLFVALPLLWVLLLSVKTLPDAYTNQIIPRFGLTLEHYWQTWGAIGSLRRNFLNSAMVAVGSISLTVAAASLLAYAVVHLRFRAKAVVIVTAFAALLIPVRVSGIIGVWAVQRQLDLLDSVLGLIPPYSTFGLAVGFFIMKSTFELIPKELMEAAEVDGASPLWRFWHVGVPLARNGLIVAGLTQFILSWGDYLLAVTLTTSRESRTLPVLLATATGGMGAWNWPSISAVFVMASLPVLIVFIFVYRRFMQGVLEGGLRG